MNAPSQKPLPQLSPIFFAKIDLAKVPRELLGFAAVPVEGAVTAIDLLLSEAFTARENNIALYREASFAARLWAGVQGLALAGRAAEEELFNQTQLLKQGLDKAPGFTALPAKAQSHIIRQIDEGRKYEHPWFRLQMGR